MHVFRCKNSKFALARHIERLPDHRFRMQLICPYAKRLFSNWHGTLHDAFEHLAQKAISQQSASICLETPAKFRKGINTAGVKHVYQIYGVFRDDVPMKPRFQLSSNPWRAYCCLHNCRYILWTGDQLDTLIQKFASQQIVNLSLNVRFLVQRCDIGLSFRAFHIWRSLCRPRCIPEPN